MDGLPEGHRPTVLGDLLEPGRPAVGEHEVRFCNPQFLLFLLRFHRLWSFVEFGFNLIEGVKEALRRDGGAHQQNAEDIPSEHMPPGGVRALDPHLNGFGLQFFRNPGHPEERIDERRRDAQQIRDPVTLGSTAEDLIELRLQAAQRHIQQEKQPGREEIDKAEPESGPVCMLESHREKSTDEMFYCFAVTVIS